MIELMIVAQLSTTPQPTGVNNNSNRNVITAPLNRPAARNRTQFNPPSQKFPGFEVEPFPKQPSLTEYLELQRRNGNTFGVPRQRLEQFR